MTRTASDPRLSAQVGALIRRRREACGFTAVDVALAAGMSRSGLAHLENGHSCPTLTVLFRIATVLKVDAVDLLPRTGGAR